MTPFSYPQLFCLLTPFCHSLRLSLLGSCCWVKIFSFAFLGDCTNIATRGEVLTHNWHPQGPACRRLWLSHLSFFLSFFFDWGWSCLISTPNVIFRTFEENLFRKWNKMKKKKKILPSPPKIFVMILFLKIILENHFCIMGTHICPWFLTAPSVRDGDFSKQMA